MRKFKNKNKFLTSFLAFALMVSSAGAPLFCCTGAVSAKSSKMKLNKTSVEMNVKATVKLKVTGTSKKVTWSSSNKNVATVSSKGKVTAKKKGKATITAKVGELKLKCKVTVKAKPYLNYRKYSLHMTYGMQLTLANATKKVKWHSSDAKVVTVSKNGYVYATGPGNAVVTAVHDGVSYKCKFTVKWHARLDTLNDVSEYVEPKLLKAFKQLDFSYLPNVGWDDKRLNDAGGLGLFDISSRQIRCVTSGAEIVVHEFGHFLDHLKGYVSSSSEFQSIWLDERDILGSTHDHAYLRSNEYFAESYMQYRLYPDDLQKRPKTYAYVKKMAESVSDADTTYLRKKYAKIWGLTRH